MSDDDNKNDYAQLTAVISELSEKVGALEQKMNAIPHDRHNEEHEYIKIEIERKKAQRDFWLDQQRKIATAGILGTIGLIIGALGYAIKQYVSTH